MNEKRDWRESLWNTLTLLHSLLVVESGMELLCWESGGFGCLEEPLVHSVKQDCRCEQQMNNRSFSLRQSFFSLCFHFWIVYLSFWPSPLSHICTIVFACTYPFFFLPVQTGCIIMGSHMLLAESQLSLLSQSDGPGHTSGNPWQGSPLPSLLHHSHPLYRTDWIEIFHWLLRLLKQQNRYRTKHVGEVFLSSRSWGEVTHALAQGLFSTTLPHSIYQLSINQRIIIIYLLMSNFLCWPMAFH